MLGLSDEFADVYKVNPGKKIKKIKVQDPVKADNNEISKSSGIILSGTGDARSMRAIAGSTAP